MWVNAHGFSWELRRFHHHTIYHVVCSLGQMLHVFFEDTCFHKSIVEAGPRSQRPKVWSRQGRWVYAQVCFATEAQVSMPRHSHVMMHLRNIWMTNIGMLVPHHIRFCFIKFLEDLHDWAVLTTRIDGIYHLPPKLLEAGGPLPELGTASRRGRNWVSISIHVPHASELCDMSTFPVHVIILNPFGRYRAVICVVCRFPGSSRIVAKTFHSVYLWSFLIWSRSIKTPVL